MDTAEGVRKLVTVRTPAILDHSGPWAYSHHEDQSFRHDSSLRGGGLMSAGGGLMSAAQIKFERTWPIFACSVLRTQHSVKFCARKRVVYAAHVLHYC